MKRENFWQNMAKKRENLQNVVGFSAKVVIFKNLPNLQYSMK